MHNDFRYNGAQVSECSICPRHARRYLLPGRSLPWRGRGPLSDMAPTSSRDWFSPRREADFVAPGGEVPTRDLPPSRVLRRFREIRGAGIVHEAGQFRG